MNRIEYRFAELLYAFFNFTIKALQTVLFKRPPSDPKTILILRAGHLGDTLCAVPALRAVQKRFPNARKILLTNRAEGGLPPPKEILGGLVQFDQIITYHPSELSNRSYLRELIAAIRLERIELVIYLGQSIATFTRVLRDMIFFKAAGCRSAVGFQVDTHRYFVLAQRHNRKFLQESDRLMNLLKPLGISSEIDFEIPKSNFPITGKLPKNRPLVALHPSAKYPSKRWPLERFAEVGKALQDRYRASIVIVGGSDTKDDAKFLTKSLGADVVDLTGQTDFLESAEILRSCDFLLSNDTGPVHIAAAVHTPVVGIYAARDFPNAWYPSGTGHQILRKDVDCQICYLETCPIMICMNQISTVEVLRACEEILKNRRVKPL